jgi:hypothetical protein
VPEKDNHHWLVARKLNGITQRRRSIARLRDRTDLFGGGLIGGT